MITFQIYIDEEFSKITVIKNSNQIFNHKLSKYYSIKDGIALKNYSGNGIYQTSINRGNEIAVANYFACPLSNNNEVLTKQNVWISICIAKKFSDRLLDNKISQENDIKDFIKNSFTTYKSHEFSTDYLMRVRKVDDNYDEYKNAIDRTGLPYDDSKLIILTEKHGYYEARSGNTQFWTLIIMIISNLWCLLIIVMCKSPILQRLQ